MWLYDDEDDDYNDNDDDDDDNANYNDYDDYNDDCNVNDDENENDDENVNMMMTIMMREWRMTTKIQVLRPYYLFMHLRDHVWGLRLLNVAYVETFWHVSKMWCPFKDCTLLFIFMPQPMF